TEWIASACATEVIAVSESLGKTYSSMNLAAESKIKVLGSGSSNGININGQSPKPQDLSLLKAKLGIPVNAKVLGFVGRLTFDKGIVELLNSFEGVLVRHPETWLFIAGNFEKGDPLPSESVEKIQNHPQIIFAGFIEDPSPVY